MQELRCFHLRRHAAPQLFETAAREEKLQVLPWGQAWDCERDDLFDSYGITVLNGHLESVKYLRYFGTWWYSRTRS